MTLFVPIAMVLLSVSARADCGDQFYLVNPSSVPAHALRRAVGIISFMSEPSASTEPIHVFRDRAGTKATEVRVGHATPVSSIPTCRERIGFDGNLFIATEIASGTIKFIADWRTSREVWFRPGTGVYRHYLRSFNDTDPRRGYEVVDVFFRHDRVKVYSAPRIGAKFTYLQVGPTGDRSRQRSAYKVMARRGIFIRIGDGGWEGQELKPVGWIRLRDSSGALAVWPAYYDDC